MSELADRPLRVPEEPLLLHGWRLVRWFANLRLVPKAREHQARILTRVFRSVFYEGLTRPGKIVLICSLLVFLFSYRNNSDFLLAGGAAGLALLWWSAILGSAWRPQVAVQRRAPEFGVVGQPLVSEVRIRNEGHRDLHDFTVRELRVHGLRWPGETEWPHRGHLAPGQETRLSVQAIPRQRGLLQLPGLAVHSDFPFFLTRCTWRDDTPTEVPILPAPFTGSLPSLRQIAEQAARRFDAGADASRSGPSLDYAYSRPFQTGDSLRRLDHRAGSRRGQPMSKVFEGVQEVRRDQVYLLVDATLLDFAPWQPRPPRPQPLDARLAVAVEIGRAAQTEGFRLAALATDDTWHSLNAPGDFYRGIAHCQPQRAQTDAWPLPAQPADDHGLHILVLGRWTPAHRARLEQWRQRGVLVLVYLVAESPREVGTLPLDKAFVEVA